MQLEADEGKGEHSIARLCEKRGEGWLVRWFYRPDDVAQHAKDRYKTINMDKEVFYSLCADEVEVSSIVGLEDMIFSTATNRTVRKGQKLCRFIYDGAKEKLHKFSEGGFTPVVTRDIAAMVAASSRAPPPKAGAVQAHAEEEGAGGYVGSGPALSDSESDQEEEDASEQEDEDMDLAFEVYSRNPRAQSCTFFFCIALKP